MTGHMYHQETGQAVSKILNVGRIMDTVVPIVYEEESLGLQVVENNRSRNHLAQSEISLLMGVASQTATDMTMPNLTGEKLIQQIRDIRSDIPVILCTGFSEQISAERAKELGISAYILKPLVMSKLASAVRSALDKG